MEMQVGVVQEHGGEQQLLYKTSGTCSQFIEVGVRDGKLSRCVFHGGCDGNTKGICSLVQGMDVSEVIKRLDGIRCGTKRTSCPDQLCRALEQLQK